MLQKKITTLKAIPRNVWATKPQIPGNFEKHSGSITEIVLHHSGAVAHMKVTIHEGLTLIKRADLMVIVP